MAVSVIVGGQYGSEGKGKVALHIARRNKAAAVVRVGGSNSGHTGVDDFGTPRILRQLPASSLVSSALVVLPAGSMIDPELLLEEVAAVKLDPRRLVIDSHASVILRRHKDQESTGRLQERIGSTCSGTGAALIERISRNENHQLASQHPLLKPFISNFVPSILRELLRENRSIVVEGTQGFGLSIWHGGHFPYATSRDTTAASFLAEAGLAVRDVKDVILVIRSYPIRVAGNSGPLPNEIDWPLLAAEGTLPKDFVEYTSATRRIRRVARFDPQVVRDAITVNRPNRIVLNHLDYIEELSKITSPKIKKFVGYVESSIGQEVDLLGFGPNTLVENPFHEAVGHRSYASTS